LYKTKIFQNSVKMHFWSFAGHYDPYRAVETSSNYTYFCNPNNPFACEVGDLSNKQVSKDKIHFSASNYA